MNINRHNYEEFFILYLDNELSPADRESVALFVQENPDLEEEFGLLQQSRFVADTALVFEEKDQLMRFSDNSAVTPGNYEQWLLLYIDNELTAAQRAAVEDFAAAHPEVKEELEILQHTKVQPENAIVFPFKDSLYRKEEKATVVTIRWWRMAAAAAVLLAVSLIGFYTFNNSTEPVTGGIAETPGMTTGPAGSSPKSEQAPTRPAIHNDSPVIDPLQEQMNIAARPIQKHTPPAGNRKTPANPQQETIDPAIALPNERNRNNLPQPLGNPNVRTLTEPNKHMAINDPAQRPLTDPKENNRSLPVTSDKTQPFIQTANTSTEGGDMADAGQPEKKARFRGLLRKITRTIEKNTNIKATDEDDRLLVAGLAIRL